MRTTPPPSVRTGHFPLHRGGFPLRRIGHSESFLEPPAVLGVFLYNKQQAQDHSCASLLVSTLIMDPCVLHLRQISYPSFPDRS